MNSILITGGSGLVGYALKKYIDLEKYNTIFLSSKDCDLTDRNLTLELFDRIKPTYVIHLAAYVGGLFHNMKNKVKFFSDNIRMNENVLEACHKNNVQRGIFCLSSCVFPANPKTYPMKIEDLNSSEPHYSNESYAYAKRMLELQCRNYNEQYNREYICIVPVNIYGENDNFNLETSHFIPAIIHKIYLAKQNNTDLYIEGNGKCLRQVIYSQDLAKIIILILEQYKDKIPVLCSNPSQEYFIKEIVEKIVKISNFNGNVIYKGTSNGIFKKSISSDIKRLYPNFKFTDIDEGLRNVINWVEINYPNIRK